MKTSFLAAAAISCSFVCNVEGHQHTVPTFCQLISQNERQILEQNCQLIRAQVAEYFASFTGPFVGYNSAFLLTVKQEISNYLLSVGTPTALQLLKEFQANGFRSFVN
jgi:hypothetical protein